MASRSRWTAWRCSRRPWTTDELRGHGRADRLHGPEPRRRQPPGALHRGRRVLLAERPRAGGVPLHHVRRGRNHGGVSRRRAGRGRRGAPAPHRRAGSRAGRRRRGGGRRGRRPRLRGGRAAERRRRASCEGRGRGRHGPHRVLARRGGTCRGPGDDQPAERHPPPAVRAGPGARPQGVGLPRRGRPCRPSCGRLRRDERRAALRNRHRAVVAAPPGLRSHGRRHRVGGAPRVAESVGRRHRYRGRAGTGADHGTERQPTGLRGAGGCRPRRRGRRAPSRHRRRARRFPRRRSDCALQRPTRSLH